MKKIEGEGQIMIYIVTYVIDATILFSLSPPLSYTHTWCLLGTSSDSAWCLLLTLLKNQMVLGIESKLLHAKQVFQPIKPSPCSLTLYIFLFFFP